MPAKQALIAVFVVVLIIGSYFIFKKLNNFFPPKANQPMEGENKTMKIESSAFNNNETIPKKYTCDGENINPPLEFSEIPDSAKSLVLIVDDPDAPAGTWTHWIIWNIDSKITMIKENSVPQGSTEGITNSGKAGYSGPCPPSGTHRYFFKIYALDNKLNIPPDTSRANLEKEMSGHILAKGELVGLYSRQ